MVKRLKKYKKINIKFNKKKKSLLTELVEITVGKSVIKCLAYNVDLQYLKILSVRENNTTFKENSYFKKHLAVTKKEFDISEEKYGVRI